MTTLAHKSDGEGNTNDLDDVLLSDEDSSDADQHNEDRRVDRIRNHPDNQSDAMRDDDTKNV